MIESKLTLKLLKVIQAFEPIVKHGDQDWTFYLKVKRKWKYFHAKKYRDTMYIFCDGLESIEINESGELNKQFYRDELDILAECATQIASILKLVKKDPIQFHRALIKSIPPALRKGIISRKFVNQLIPDYRPFHKELSANDMRDIIAFLQGPHRDTKIESPTAGKFFEYCRIAYLANASDFKGELDTKMSGLEMYKRWADGRDGGLSKLPLDSTEAFQAWYDDQERRGSHPWEIYRGGNSTHIDLAATKEYGAWKIKLIAFASTRLAETCRIALALYKANLPFDLEHAESYQKRLLAEDYIGILPEADSIAYGWHRFPKEFDVADCIHYSWFKDEDKRSLLPMSQIKSLITWFPIQPIYARHDPP